MGEQYGFIYVISNSNEIGRLKIGMTTNSNPLKRIKQFKTGVSVKWKVEKILRVPNTKIFIIDNQIKKILEPYNVKDGGGTEFFAMTLDTLSGFMNVFLFYNPDCIEVSRSEIDEMNKKVNTAQGKPKKRGNGDDLPRGYLKTYEESRETGYIHFMKNLKIPPFAGRNDILKTTPLDLYNVNSVKIWLKELKYITDYYRGKYRNSNGNLIYDVTSGNGNLKAFLGKYI